MVSTYGGRVKIGGSSIFVMNFLAARDRDEFLSVFERRHGRLVSANKPAIKYIKDDES